MKTRIVKDLMVSLSQYATVSETATLYEAILALEKAQEAFGPDRYRHRAILVMDNNNWVVGKLGVIDVLIALEPEYKDIGDPKVFSRSGLSPQFLKSMQARYSLWDKPLNDICSKAAGLRVKSFMYTPKEGEYVREDATMDEAIHQLVVGHHQSLLVTRSEEIVGILRLTDVFHEICGIIKTCKL